MHEHPVCDQHVDNFRAGVSSGEYPCRGLGPRAHDAMWISNKKGLNNSWLD